MADTEGRGPHEGSRTARIVALDVGQTFAEAERLSFDETTSEMMKERLTAWRKTIAAPIARAKDRTGGTYTLDTGTMFTTSQDILLVAAVTRTA